MPFARRSKAAIIRSDLMYIPAPDTCNSLELTCASLLDEMAPYSNQLRNGGVFMIHPPSAGELEDESRGRLHLSRLQAIGT
jgi:hypothetical protein